MSPPKHGVFGTQTTELLKMISQKGPLTSDLGMTQAYAHTFNPDLVKHFSPPKRPAVPTSTPSEPPTSRGPDIANSSSVPPELSKLPPTFSIFPVMTGAAGGQAQETSQPPNSYYQVTMPC